MPDTKSCPYCAEEIRAEAVKCRYCGSSFDGRAVTRGWVRRRDGKMIAGVCTGLAQEFDVPVTVLRLAFVLGTLFGGGVGILIYLVLWVVMPYAPTFGVAGERWAPPGEPPGWP